MDKDELDARRAAYLVDMADKVAQHGLAIQGVFHSGMDRLYAQEPDFAYTVGLAAVGKPELIAFGLPMNVAHAVLNDLGFRMLRNEIEVAAGDTLMDLVATYPVRLVAVTDSWKHLTISNTFYGNPDGVLPALQLVFPDMAGHFPWEMESEVDWQPVLGPVTDTEHTITLPEPEEKPDE